MSESVHVRSIDAVENFRHHLIVFAAKAKPLVEDTFDDVCRSREWLRSDRRLHWENELRRRKRVLQEAQERYFNARTSNLREATTSEQMAVRRARADVEFAEQKLQLIRRWTGEFERTVWPLLKQLEQLRSVIGQELPEASRLLAELVSALDQYRESERMPAPTSEENPANAAEEARA